MSSLPHLPEQQKTYVRFGHVFPNLIPVLAPAEFSYLRIDPVAPERIRLVARSFDLGGDLAGLRDFRREAIDRTNQQDIGVVTRVQRGLRARGLPAGAHSSFLECRIGHFEQMVSHALAVDASDALPAAATARVETSILREAVLREAHRREASAHSGSGPSSAPRARPQRSRGGFDDAGRVDLKTTRWAGPRREWRTRLCSEI